MLSKITKSNKNVEIREVNLICLDQITIDYSLSGPFVIKADVQGTELDVIEGSKAILEETELIILETSLFEFLPNNPQFFDVINYMKNIGFVVYDFIGGAIRPFDGALGQIDVAFVKENGVLRQSHEYGTSK
ncbi:MAG: FkbM family methyltransferase [Anaerolineaceae bacterium]|nr:FkbM family methyltransferase [Anaerolineaceae bacterium]